MEGWRRIGNVCVTTVAVVFAWLPAMAFGQEIEQQPQPSGPQELVGVQEEPGPIENVVKHLWGYVDPDHAEVISVHQLTCLIDHLDKSLACRGQVVVKNPDVWGQNRMTQYRADYEAQMKVQLTAFEVILNSYQRVSDAAALYQRDFSWCVAGDARSRRQKRCRGYTCEHSFGRWASRSLRPGDERQHAAGRRSIARAHARKRGEPVLGIKGRRRESAWSQRCCWMSGRIFSTIFKS